MRSSYGVAGRAIMCLNVELELTIQKSLNLLHDDLGPNSQKLWVIFQSIHTLVIGRSCFLTTRFLTPSITKLLDFSISLLNIDTDFVVVIPWP